MDSPEKGWRLFSNDGTDYFGVYRYASQIIFFTDPQSYTIVRLATIFDFLTFSSYSATAAFFATLSFCGMWMFFQTFYEHSPWLHRGIAIAAFFIPSVFFWGSGLLKDTVTLACLGAATYTFRKIFLLQQKTIWRILIFSIALIGLYKIKVYILLAFVPSCIFWFFLYHLRRVPSPFLRIMLYPAVISLAIGLGYFALVKAGEDNPRYSLAKIGQTAQITAYDIRYFSGRDAGSGYSLGELDGSVNSMIRLAPQAINVALFRPYLWEVRNPLMLLSALESFVLLMVVLYLVYRINFSLIRAVDDPTIIFLLIFSLIFSFSVGVSTFNFGTLVRYKIPMLPFFAMALLLINDYSKRDRKLDTLEVTE